MMNTDDHVYVDEARVGVQIELLLKRRLRNPELAPLPIGWGRKVQRDAQIVAVTILMSGCRFFNRIGCGVGNPIAAHCAVEFLVAIGAADKGRLPTMMRGDDVYLSLGEAYYLLLDPQ